MVIPHSKRPNARDEAVYDFGRGSGAYLSICSSGTESNMQFLKLSFPLASDL